jgi:hypothetical protein
VAEGALGRAPLPGWRPGSSRGSRLPTATGRWIVRGALVVGVGVELDRVPLVDRAGALALVGVGGALGQLDGEPVAVRLIGLDHAQVGGRTVDQTTEVTGVDLLTGGGVGDPQAQVRGPTLGDLPEGVARGDLGQAEPRRQRPGVGQHQRTVQGVTRLHVPQVEDRLLVLGVRVLQGARGHRGDRVAGLGGERRTRTHRHRTSGEQGSERDEDLTAAAGHERNSCCHPGLLTPGTRSRGVGCRHEERYGPPHHAHPTPTPHTPHDSATGQCRCAAATGRAREGPARHRARRTLD